MEWVWRFNHHCLLGPIGDMPPVEYDEAYYLARKLRRRHWHSRDELSREPGAVHIFDYYDPVRAVSSLSARDPLVLLSLSMLLVAGAFAAWRKQDL